MIFISLNTASAITGLSKRTLWRRIGDGTLRTEEAGAPGEQTRVAMDDLEALSRFHLDRADRDLLAWADAGNPEAECELALLFLAEGLAAEAVTWLEKAARRLYPEAMHWLGRCHLAGNGVPANEAEGTAWIAKAARHGHLTAQHLLRYLQDPARPALAPAALEAALDDIERRLVFDALNETASGSGKQL
jgi:TPR repeat protein